MKALQIPKDILVKALLVTTLAAAQAAAQANNQVPRPKPSQTLERELPPTQTFERELTGTEAHRYRFELSAGEFFQAGVEQKGVDLALRLKDGAGNVLAMMDSPNDERGPEVLSFVAAKSGPYTLDVFGLKEGRAKGVYTIRREVSRPATARDSRRVEVERLFVEAQTARDIETALAKAKAAQAGWRELSDSYMEGLTALLSKRFTAAGTAGEALSLAEAGTVESNRKALEKMREAHRLFVELGDKEAEAEALFWVSSLSADLGEQAAALQLYEKAAALLLELGDGSLLATTLNNMGLIHYRAGRLLKALTYYERALPLLDAPGDKAKKALTLSNIGQVYTDLDEPDKAIEYLNRALPLTRESKDRAVEARMLNNLGVMYRGRGESKRAFEVLEEALRIRKEIGDEEGATNTSINLAQAKSHSTTVWPCHFSGGSALVKTRLSS